LIAFFHRHHPIRKRFCAFPYFVARPCYVVRYIS
jgi:hypothetical protein